jgi:translation initiation factor 1A
MVRNTTGGNKHRSQARKNVNDSKQSNKLRFVEEDGEVYAQVLKLYGNGMCQVYCNDKKTRLCIIRGKFRGKGKRGNILTLGSMVMIGIREWENDKCDLLCIYNEGEKQRLYDTDRENDWSEYKKNDCINQHIAYDDNYDDIVFTRDDTDDEYKKLINVDINNNKNANRTLELKVDNSGSSEEEDGGGLLNFDDI